MNDLMPTTQASSAPGNRSFGRALLDALHESRRRQAVREIHNHRHLIAEAKACELWRAIARSHVINARPKQAASGASVQSWLAILTIPIRGLAHAARRLVLYRLRRLAQQGYLEEGQSS
jgi:hypothetical protein